MIGDWFFVLMTFALFVMGVVVSVYSFLATYTAGDPLGELASYENKELAEGMSKIHMTTAIMMCAWAILLLTVCPAWSEYEHVPQSEYTYELRTDETVFATGFDTLKTDRVRWANIADNPEKYCVYKVKTYNLLGMWPSDPRLSLGSPPCKDTEKYELRN